MNDVIDLVVGKYDGSLKAEHGTGRNMAPFVEYEWGEEAYAIMKEVKQLFDPKDYLIRELSLMMILNAISSTSNPILSIDNRTRYPSNPTDRPVHRMWVL